MKVITVFSFKLYFKYEITVFLCEINYLGKTIWVISSGKMVISRKMVCFLL